MIIKKVKLFSKALRPPLGIEFIRDDDGCVGFGTNGKPSLWLCKENSPQKPMHIAFIAQDRKSVDAFHAAAISAGAKDNGPSKKLSA